MNVFLIGPRACGKTTVGRLVATALGRPFVDLDDDVAARFEEDTVQAIWTAHGEAGWRAAELAALEDVLAGTDRVVALGGGTPTIAAARALVEAEQAAGRACVVYLETAAETLSSRLRDEQGDRPSLTGGDVAEEIGAVLAERAATYAALADHVIDASAEPERVASWVVRQIEEISA